MMSGERSRIMENTQLRKAEACRNVVSFTPDMVSEIQEFKKVWWVISEHCATSTDGRRLVANSLKAFEHKLIVSHSCSIASVIESQEKNHVAGERLSVAGALSIGRSSSKKNTTRQKNKEEEKAMENLVLRAHIRKHAP